MIIDTEESGVRFDLEDGAWVELRTLNGDDWYEINRKTITTKPFAQQDKAGNCANKLHRKMGDTHVGSDELERPQRQECRKGMCHWPASAQSESRRRSDHCLFTNPDIDEPEAQGSGKVPDSCTILGRHDNNALVSSCHGL